MDVALQECESRRQQREQQDQETYHYPLPVPAAQPSSSRAALQQPSNTSVPELAPLRPPELSSTAHSVVSSLPPPPTLTIGASPVPLSERNNPHPYTSVPLSISSDTASHRSSSSLSSSSGMSSTGFEVIPQDEACAGATASETNNAQTTPLKQPVNPASSHSAEQSAPLPPPPPPAPTPRATRSTATCFHTPTVVEAHRDTPAVGFKRKKRAANETPGTSCNTRGASKQKTTAVAPVPTKISDEQSAQINVQQLWTRNVQMSAAMADLDRRLGTVECLVDLQRKRVEDHKAEIVALKKLLKGKENGKS